MIRKKETDMEYEAPLIYEFKIEEIELMCACTADDHNPYRTPTGPVETI